MYTNREDYAKDGDAYLKDGRCQLIAGHAGRCDPRGEETRWRALFEAIDGAKDEPE